jgi:hypothetical protein
MELEADENNRARLQRKFQIEEERSESRGDAELN